MTSIGRVTANGEAIVSLTIHPVKGTNPEVDALLDTGFNGDLALPSGLIATLGLEELGREQVTLASGRTKLVRKYEATLEFGGAIHSVEVIEARAALVGMGLLWGHDLQIQCVDGGHVSLDSVGE